MFDSPAYIAVAIRPSNYVYRVTSEVMEAVRGHKHPSEAKNIMKEFTPFENAQRWMGKNIFHFLLLNDDNMIEEH